MATENKEMEMSCSPPDRQRSGEIIKQPSFEFAAGSQSAPLQAKTRALTKEQELRRQEFKPIPTSNVEERVSLAEQRRKKKRADRHNKHRMLTPKVATVETPQEEIDVPPIESTSLHACVGTLIAAADASHAKTRDAMTKTMDTKENEPSEENSGISDNISDCDRSVGERSVQLDLDSIEDDMMKTVSDGVATLNSVVGRPAVCDQLCLKTEGI